MLLTCPNCRSGLQVPDGTTALVRCPACKTVFSPADSETPEPEETEEPEAEEQPAAPVARKPKRTPQEDETPKKRARKSQKSQDNDEAEDENDKNKNRDIDPETEEEDRKRKKKKRKYDDSGLTPAEKAERRRAFDRAAVGCKLIWVSFALFMLSMLLILVFFFQAAFSDPLPIFITFAGIVGLINWLLAAVGVGLCLSGPRAPGHWGYGIAAAVAIGVHLLLIAILVSQGREFAVGKAEDPGVKWGLIPTRLNATMFYLTAIVYPENQGITPRGPMVFSMVVGVIEMTRTVLIMMFLSCLARAALDDGLAHKCTRAAGIASIGPGALGLLIFVFVATVIETNAGLNMFTLVLFATVNMGVYSIVNGTILPSFMAAREVADACDEPFQSLIPQM